MECYVLYLDGSQETPIVNARRIAQLVFENIVRDVTYEHGPFIFVEENGDVDLTKRPPILVTKH